MSIRILTARGALTAFCAMLLLSLAPSLASAKTVTAELRVLTPTRVLDPGTSYVVGEERVRTDRAADCNFGGAGGTGASYDQQPPTALGLLAAGADADRRLSPLSISDEFGFGLAICGIGKVDDREGTFWYLKRDHRELIVGADQERIHDGDQFLVYLAPDMFPAPNPAELELRGPARARPDEAVTIRAIEHACVTDQVTFEVGCSSDPAPGVEIQAGSTTVTTGADGTARVTAAREGRLRLVGRRGTDIPSNRLELCVNDDRDACAARRGERIVGRSAPDRIKGSAGGDVIRARGGGDRIDIRGGGPDRVDCGPGKDRVLVERSERDDRLARDCERIRRR